MTTAIPPGFNTRCISAKTSRGFVKYCTLAAHRTEFGGFVQGSLFLKVEFLHASFQIVWPTSSYCRIVIRHGTLSARVATSKVLSAHGNFCFSFKSCISPSCFVQTQWSDPKSIKASCLAVSLFFHSWSWNNFPEQFEKTLVHIRQFNPWENHIMIYHFTSLRSSWTWRSVATSFISNSTEFKPCTATYQRLLLHFARITQITQFQPGKLFQSLQDNENSSWSTLPKTAVKQLLNSAQVISYPRKNAHWGEHRSRTLKPSGQACHHYHFTSVDALQCFGSYMVLVYIRRIFLEFLAMRWI